MALSYRQLALASVQATATTGTVPTPLPVADPDRRNPFFRDVFQQSYQSEPLNMPTAAPVWRWSAGERLLSLRDGNPLLTQSKVNGGTGTGKLFIYWPVHLHRPTVIWPNMPCSYLLCTKWRL